MTSAIYLGDEVSAAGFRLAGVVVRTPAPAEAGAALAAARAEAELVLLSARLAGAVGDRRLGEALEATTPLLLIVPDPEGEFAVPDLAARLQAQLGFEA